MRIRKKCITIIELDEKELDWLIRLMRHSPQTCDDAEIRNKFLIELTGEEFTITPEDYD